MRIRFAPLIANLIRCLGLAALIGGCGRKASSPPSDPRIVGSWSIVGGDYPLTNEYRADGILVQSVGSQSSQANSYRIEGNRIIVSVKQPDGGVSEQVDHFTLKGDELTFSDSDGSKRLFRRNRN